MDRYGKLVVLGDAPRNHHGQRVLRCICDCGAGKDVVEQSLKCGDTKSCGCHRVDVGKTKNLRHGARKTRAYTIWWNMKSRCERPDSKYFCAYGGRGIAVCERWQDFAAFLEDVGQPKDGYTIERIDNDRGYEPGNVRWADRKEQANNRRTNKFITHNGETLTLQQWADKTGICRSTISYRLNSGKTIKEALTK